MEFIGVFISAEVVLVKSASTVTSFCTTPASPFTDPSIPHSSQFVHILARKILGTEEVELNLIDFIPRVAHAYNIIQALNRSNIHVT